MTIGLLYFIFTFLIEYFLWFSTQGRTILFGLFFFLIDNYEYYQLKIYGQRSKVMIKEIQKTSKDLPFAVIEFESKGQSCSKELLAEKYHTGDTVEIIFSTERTEIVMWYDEFKKMRDKGLEA